MAKIVNRVNPAKQFKPFALEFETLAEAATALALLNTPITSPTSNGNVMEWVDGYVGSHKRFIGISGKEIETAYAATKMWQLIAAELGAQGFYHGLLRT